MGPPVLFDSLVAARKRKTSWVHMPQEVLRAPVEGARLTKEKLVRGPTPVQFDDIVPPERSGCPVAGPPIKAPGSQFPATSLRSLLGPRSGLSVAQSVLERDVLSAFYVAPGVDQLNHHSRLDLVRERGGSSNPSRGERLLVHVNPPVRRFVAIVARSPARKHCLKRRRADSCAPPHRAFRVPCPSRPARQSSP